MRIAQTPGARGSLKWMQRVAGGAAPETERDIVASIPGATRLEWLSPRADDDHAEYRDGAFLDRIGWSTLRADLMAFWPRRGPQWDGLAKTDSGHVLLFEAKAHTGELRSAGCQAASTSRRDIEAALKTTAVACGATAPETWSGAFYQSANRLAYLHFLRRHGVDAYLILLNCLGDSEMRGPSTVAAWQSAYARARAVMGLICPHALSPYVRHVHPDVRRLAG